MSPTESTLEMILFIFSMYFVPSRVALVITLSHVFIIAASSPTPEDWVSGSPFSHFSSDDSRASDTYSSAYINVTAYTEDGWMIDKTDVGRYGGGYVGPASGILVHVASKTNPDDHTGCTLPFVSTKSDKKLPLPGEPWVALIKRGRCNFELKVDNAFRSNAAGVIVYNDRDSPTLDKMKLSSDSGRNISAVFTFKWKGEQLAKLLENDSVVFVHITIASHTSSRAANINRTSVLFVSITFIVLMIISLAWLVFYYVQRFRYIHAKDRLSRKLGNAAKKALSKIPTKNIKSEDKEVQGDGECCAVCIEPYKINEILRILPCAHEFHKSCIDPWLLEHRTCPMCKMDILKHYGFVFTGSQESILQMDVEVAGLESNDTQSTSPRRGGGISPLPEIRAAVISDHEMLYDCSADEDSSRASTPDEMTPTLSPNSRQIPVRQDLCVSCIAAKAAAAVHQINPNTSNSSSDKDVESTVNELSSNDDNKFILSDNEVCFENVQK